MLKSFFELSDTGLPAAAATALFGAKAFISPPQIKNYIVGKPNNFFFNDAISGFGTISAELRKIGSCAFFPFSEIIGHAQCRSVKIVDVSADAPIFPNSADLMSPKKPKHEQEKKKKGGRNIKFSHFEKNNPVPKSTV